jgi:hypothetical protein
MATLSITEVKHCTPVSNKPIKKNNRWKSDINHKEILEHLIIKWYAKYFDGKINRNHNVPNDIIGNFYSIVFNRINKQIEKGTSLDCKTINNKLIWIISGMIRIELPQFMQNSDENSKRLHDWIVDGKNNKMLLDFREVFDYYDIYVCDAC